LSKTRAGKMNPKQTVAVAPVNWKTIQMLGTTAEPKKMEQMRKHGCVGYQTFSISKLNHAFEVLLTLIFVFQLIIFVLI
jgi:hypothetical protein